VLPAPLARWDDGEVTNSVEQDRPTPGRRRGRRPGGEDTKAVLLAAASEVFTEQGYEGATVRAIAKRAGVDPAMVNHWFGGKEGLFAKAVLQLPIDPKEILRKLVDGDPEQTGERIVRTFLTVWDSTGGGQFAALVRSVASHELAVQGLRDIFLKNILAMLADHFDVDEIQFRATLLASQIIGMGMVRYVSRFEPLASAEVDTLVTAVAPTLQRYLTGKIN
jgi:AcrR family transcriptional regulator